MSMYEEVNLDTRLGAVRIIATDLNHVCISAECINVNGVLASVNMHANCYPDTNGEFVANREHGYHYLSARRTGHSRKQTGDNDISESGRKKITAALLDALNTWAKAEEANTVFKKAEDADQERKRQRIRQEMADGLKKALKAATDLKMGSAMMQLSDMLTVLKDSYEIE